MLLLTLIVFTLAVTSTLAIATSTATYAYIADNDTNSIIEVNLATNSVVGSILLPFNDPTSVSVSPNGNEIYVGRIIGSTGEGNFIIINTSTQQIVGSITQTGYFGEPRGIAINSADTLGYVVDSYFQSLTILSMPAGTPLATFYRGNGVITSHLNIPGVVFAGYSTRSSLSHDGNYLYLVNSTMALAPEDPGLYIFSTVSNTIVGNVMSNAFVNPEQIAVSPDGTYAYITNFGGANVLIMDTATNTITGSISGAFNHPQGVAFTPSGNLAYVTNGGTYGVGGGNVVIVSTVSNSVVGAVSGTSFGAGDVEQGLGIEFAAGPTLTSPSISASNSVVDAGQAVTLTLSWSGGTPSYNAVFYNVTGSVVLKSTSGSGTQASNTFIAGDVASQAVYTYNGAVTDSEPAPATTNSVSITITVNPTLVAGAPSASSPSVISGHSVTITANPSGGTGSYSISWYLGAGCSGSAIGGGASLPESPSSSATYSYMVTDTGTTSPATACSHSVTITVTQPSEWRGVPIITVLPKVVPISGSGESAGRGGCNLLNMTRSSSELCNVGNESFEFRQGVVSRNTSTTMINGNSFTLSIGESMIVSNTTDGSYYVQLTGINYTNVYAGAPTANLKLYFLPIITTTATTSSSTTIQTTAATTLPTTTTVQKAQQGGVLGIELYAAIAITIVAAGAAYGLWHTRMRSRHR